MKTVFGKRHEDSEPRSTAWKAVWAEAKALELYTLRDVEKQALKIVKVLAEVRGHHAAIFQIRGMKH